MESEQGAERGARRAMTIPLALAVARRALLVAIVAVLVAIAALVAALLSGSGSDPPESADTSQAQADVAAARAEASEAVARAEAAAARAEDAVAAVLAAVTGAEEAALTAQEAATLAQEAAGMAFEASVRADMAGAKVAAAEEPLAEASDDTGAAAPADDAAAPETTVEDTEVDAVAVDEESEPAPADGPEDAPGDAPEDAPGDGSEPATEDPAVALPGEPYEFGPPAGAALAVVGVSHDSVLNVRDVPAGEIVARLDNVMNVGSEPVVYVRQPGSDGLIATLDLNRGVIATGNTRKLPTTIWHEIRMGDAVGWASSAFLSPLGATSDATAEIVAILGETPAAPTLAELGRIVAEAVASDEPPSRIVVSGAPTSGDLAEITVDVLGLPDDAVRGFRLHIFAQQESEPDPFTLKTVESTTICDTHRGVSEEGLCN